MELIEGRMWTGVIHEGGAFCSQVDDHNIHMFEFGEAFKVLGNSEDQDKAPKLARALAAVGSTADGISATTAETAQRINVRFLEQVSYVIYM